MLRGHLVRPELITDTNQAIVWQAKLEAFDRSVLTTSIGDFNIGFPGQYWDAEKQSWYNYFGDYDATTGRYLQSDPIGLEAGLNTYGYVMANPVNWVDPYGLDMLDPLWGAIYWGTGGWVPSQTTVDFSAGMGDVILFGQGHRIRSWLGTDNSVNRCSDAYSSGEWAGMGASLVTGVVGGIKAAGAKGFGLEFSHWIPNRMGGARSIWNGNYVPKKVHALSDPYRYRFMPRSWKAQNPMPSKAAQQWVRIPNVYKGGAAGTAWGASGSAINNQGCDCKP